LKKRYAFKLDAHKSIKDNPIDMEGDRDIEWSWIISQMPPGPGEALDVGPGGSYLGLIAAQEGFNVTAVDLEPINQHYSHPKINLKQGDICNIPLPENYFALVLNCSTVEHVGLSGRYGVKTNHTDGDLEAMSRLKRLMKSEGVMLLTIPVGQDSVIAPFHRIYGIDRLPRLLEGYIIEKENYWCKNSQNKWVLCEKGDALNFKILINPINISQSVYALGCFVLRK
jgi:SAM-dependent methyltransferase